MTTYKLQTTSLWRFPDRGNWATHKGDYKGNWSPHVPRNLIIRYTKRSETILDPFLGSGTTLIECKLLDRNGIGVDINKSALEISKQRLKLEIDNQSMLTLYHASATNLSMLSNNSIDFICTHPPYANIIRYSDCIDGDLSQLHYTAFINELRKVAIELKRVLKPNKYCSFMIGDIREHGNVIPLGFMALQAFLDTGFTLKEVIIKEQFNCMSSKKWDNMKNLNFYLLAHEYIFILKNAKFK